VALEHTAVDKLQVATGAQSQVAQPFRFSGSQPAGQVMSGHTWPHGTHRLFTQIAAPCVHSESSTQTAQSGLHA
jgi:hypothetical protein